MNVSNMITNNFITFVISLHLMSLCSLNFYHAKITYRAFDSNSVVKKKCLKLDIDSILRFPIKYLRQNNECYESVLMFLTKSYKKDCSSKFILAFDKLLQYSDGDKSELTEVILFELFESNTEHVARELISDKFYCLRAISYEIMLDEQKMYARVKSLINNSRLKETEKIDFLFKLNNHIKQIKNGSQNMILPR